MKGFIEVDATFKGGFFVALRRMTGISPNTMTKLNRDEEVTLSVLSKICESLKTDIGDIVEYISVEAAEEQK